MKKKIRDIISKPSEAVDAMINGLLKQEVRKDFIIDMDTYGQVGKVHPTDEGDNVCFGCAATCTVQEITSINYTSKSSIYTIGNRSDSCGIDADDLGLFEAAIDELRQGNLYTLFMYFTLIHKYYVFKNNTDVGDVLDLPMLTTLTWESNLDKYRDLSAYLKSKDL